MKLDIRAVDRTEDKSFAYSLEIADWPLQTASLGAAFLAAMSLGLAYLKHLK
ncbi:hypothetical protein ACVRZS_07375 [Streptococcus ferus]|uniref:Uncharacterized protein n=1 Tax=Streptococcus ferus TaxID=1345 RepID=A0A2X3VCL0_9STRE|nr:hypothetical protein [Streptococcus ferus]SQF39124.1 Uncharacterised protein [Streptococcus ferus]